MKGSPPRNCAAISRYVAWFASMPMPMAASTGPTSLAIVSDFCIGASCPFAGMTRIRFKGFFSAQNGHPSELHLMYAQGRGCQCEELVVRAKSGNDWLTDVRRAWPAHP